MNKYGKIWGYTSEIFSNDSISINRIYIKNGQSCSKHYHQYKYNTFFVESGNIIVYRWENDQQIESILSSGDTITIDPNIYHQFIALEDSIVYEIYYTKLDNQDIIRNESI